MSQFGSTISLNKQEKAPYFEKTSDAPAHFSKSKKIIKEEV